MREGQTPSSTPSPPTLLWIVLGITALAAALRFWQAGESLWVDELHTAWAALGSWSDVARRAAIGNQSPLFYWGEAATVRLLGTSEWSIRLPSLVAGLALVPVMMWVAWRWTRRIDAAALAGLLVALDAMFVFYAQEARPYAWVQLAALVHLATFFERLRSSLWRWRILHIASLLLAFYLHYTALLLAAGELLYLGLVALRIHRPVVVAGRDGGDRESARFAWHPWLVDAGAITLGLLPALPHLSQIAGRRANWALFVSPQPVWMIWILFPLVIYLLPTLVTRFIDGLIFLKQQRAVEQETQDANELPPADQASEASVLPLACWFLVPLILTWIATALGLAHLFFLRYVVGVSVALPLLTAFHFARIRLKPLRVFLLLVLPLALILKAGYVPQLVRDGRLLTDRSEGWREARDWIEQQERALENPERRGRPIPVYVRSGLIEADAVWNSEDPLLRRYTANPMATIYRPFRDSNQSQAYALRLVGLPTSGVARSILQHDRAPIRQYPYGWVVLRARPQNAEKILAQFSRARVDVRQSASFGNVTVARLVPRKRSRSAN